MTIGAVHLRVSDLDRSLTFYREALGLSLQRRAGDSATLGVAGETLVELRALAASTPRPRHTPGLYHFALLVPDRLELGRALGRLMAARWPLQGVADHGVSEALYLADPDGLGIEIYRDRPRAEWPMEGDRVRMVTEPLDVRALLDEASGRGAIPAGLAAGTRVGHVHLQVRDLDEAERFWHGAVGLDVMHRMAHGALFVSYAGYHHHVGLNTWGVAAGSPVPANSPGLDYFVLSLPDPGMEASLADRLAATGVPVRRTDAGWMSRDPSGNGVLIAPARRDVTAPAGPRDPAPAPMTAE